MNLIGSVKIYWRDESGDGSVPATVLVYDEDGDRLVLDLRATIDHKKGADGGMYPCVVFRDVGEFSPGAGAPVRFLRASCCKPVTGGLCARYPEHKGDCDPRIAHEDGRTWTLQMVPPRESAQATEAPMPASTQTPNPLRDYSEEQFAKTEEGRVWGLQRLLDTLDSERREPIVLACKFTASGSGKVLAAEAKRDEEIRYRTETERQLQESFNKLSEALEEVNVLKDKLARTERT